MKQLSERHEGDLKIVEDLEIFAVVNGNVTAAKRAHLILWGTILGDLTVQEGASALIHGIVGGAVLNHGGHVEVIGMVGRVRDLGQIKTLMGPNAVVIDD